MAREPRYGAFDTPGAVATREALIDALAVWAAQRFAVAVDAAHPDTAPPLVALYQTTANVLGIKAGWGFAMSRGSSANPEVARVHSDVRDTCERLFRRAGESGILRADVDISWTRRVYFLSRSVISMDPAGLQVSARPLRRADCARKALGGWSVAWGRCGGGSRG